MPFGYRLDNPTLVVLSLAFRAGEDLFGSQVADTLEETALSKLAPDTFVDAILDGIDILVASDFRLGEVVCENVSQLAPLLKGFVVLERAPDVFWCRT